MDIDHWIKLLEVLVSLLQVLIWPAFALFVLFYLGTTLKNYLNDLRRDKNVREVSAEAGPAGVRFNVKREVEVATNLALAVKSHESTSSEVKTQEVVNLVSRATTAQTIQQVAGTNILWVDDRPANNQYERRALEALGIHFTLSTSTEDALAKVNTQSFHVIISDMGRPPDRRAGYTLLEALRKQNILVPFIIYAGSRTPEEQEETRRRGGFGMATNARDLFQLVLDAIHETEHLSR